MVNAMQAVDFLLAGYERGGTTLLSELFRANGYESGFECGVLLGNSPADMKKLQPYWEMLPKGWNISENTLNEAIKGDFQHFYQTICRAAFPSFNGNFFDKTPKYMESLGACMNRAKFIKGAVIIHRDPRAVFVSLSKRLTPGEDTETAIKKNFKILQNRYMSYFLGSIGHIENPNVLFIPFEEIVSREDVWLRTLGYFTRGEPFKKRTSNSRFVNVSSSKMDLRKIIEFDDLLTRELQEKILEATRVASLFFASPVERARYGEIWETTLETAKKRLSTFELPAVGMDVDGIYFEPLTYLIRYPDVLKSGSSPVVHFQKAGRREKRIAA